MIHVIDDDGRITQTMFTHDAQAVAFLEAAGHRVMELGTGPNDSYFDMTNPERPAYRKRPVWAAGPATLQPVTGETVMLGVLPACRLTVNGPLGLHTFDHPGGEPAQIVFDLAGQYVVSWEAFPFQTVSWSFDVTSKHSGAQ